MSEREKLASLVDNIRDLNSRMKSSAVLVALGEKTVEMNAPQLLILSEGLQQVIEGFSAACASNDTLREENERLKDGLRHLSTAFTAHGYSDAMDAVQEMRDFASSFLPTEENEFNGDTPEEELNDEELSMIDAAWNLHKASKPVARIVNDNQPGKTAIIALLCDPPTLGVGTHLYAVPHAAEQRLAVVEGILRDLADEVFGRGLGSEPNVYADYDMLCELERRARAALKGGDANG